MTMHGTSTIRKDQEMFAVLDDGKIVNGRAIDSRTARNAYMICSWRLNIVHGRCMELDLTSEHGRTEIGVQEK